jgi:hypothetical protein
LLSKDKRPPSSPAHEREAEPFYWLHAEKPECDYKKTHAMVMGNDNPARNADAHGRWPWPALPIVKMALATR